MENCEDFHKLQHLCEVSNDFVKDFSKIAYRGGNEMYIKEISSRIDTLLKQLGHVRQNEVANSPACRKIFLFLLLNTTASYSHDLEKNDYFCHVLKKTPQLTQCLFLNAIWNLPIERFVYEFLETAPLWMVVPWLGELATCVRFDEPFNLIEKCYLILRAVISNSLSGPAKDLEARSSELLEHIATFLSNFNSPPKEVGSFPDAKKNKFQGFAVMWLVKLTIQLLQSMKAGSSAPKKVDKDLEIYKLLRIDTKAGQTCTDFQPETFLAEYGNSLLNTLENQVMQVTADMFIDWVDIDMPDPSGLIDEYSLQSTIGNLAAEVAEANSDSLFSHEVFAKLDCIKVARPPAADVAKGMSMTGLMCRLEDPGAISAVDFKALVREFVNRGLIYDNEECLETLEKVSSYLDQQDIRVVLENVEGEDIDEQCQVKIGKILEQILSRLPTPELISLIRFEGFRNVQFKRTEAEHFIFNIDLSPSKYLLEVFKRPQNWLSYLPALISNCKKFSLATHKKALENYVHVIKLLGSVRDKFEPELKQQVLSALSLEPSEAVLQGLAVFFPGLFSSKFYSNDFFIQEFVINSIVDLEGDKAGHKAHNVAHVLVKILDLWDCGKFLAPLSVSFGLILDNCRKRLEKYVQSNQLIETLVAVIKKLIKKIVSEKDKRFVLAETKSTHPLTKFYFENGLSPKEAQKTLDEYLFPASESQSKQVSAARLCDFLSKMSINETAHLVQSERLLPLFLDAMLIIVMTVPKDRFGLVVNVCFRNFGTAFQRIVSLENSLAVQMSHLKQVVRILGHFEDEETQETCILGILPSLKKLIENIAGQSKESKASVEAEIQKLKNKDIVSGVMIGLFD